MWASGTWSILGVLGQANMMDRLKRKLSSLVRPFYCILCQGWGRAEHILCRCELVSLVWDSLFQTFCTMVTQHKDVGALLENSLFKLPHGEKGHFLWLARVCAILWVVWNEWKNRVFRGVERVPSKIWSLL